MCTDCVCWQLGQQIIDALGLETGRWLHINRQPWHVACAKIWLYFWLLLALSQLITLWFTCNREDVVSGDNKYYSGGYTCVDSQFVFAS